MCDWAYVGVCVANDALILSAGDICPPCCCGGGAWGALAANACRIRCACDIGSSRSFASLYMIPSADCGVLLEELSSLRCVALDDVASVFETAN
jgi:hypothetical protein